MYLENEVEYKNPFFFNEESSHIIAIDIVLVVTLKTFL